MSINSQVIVVKQIIIQFRQENIGPAVALQHVKNLN